MQDSVGGMPLWLSPYSPAHMPVEESWFLSGPGTVADWAHSEFLKGSHHPVINK